MNSMTREEAIKTIQTATVWTDEEREALGVLIPELCESEDEDERIRMALIKLMTVAGERYVMSATGFKKERLLAYLEKKKDIEDRWIEDREQCFWNGVEEGKMLTEKQKEPHYTKRNALFDKCVENCDPKTVEEVNKRVDDIINMPELSPFEQALTNFIGDWEDDEEHWPSQFVKKHGKHILDMAREELQKEQKPSHRFLPNDWVVYDGPLGHAILQIDDVIDGRYTFVDNDSTLLMEDSDKFLRPLTPKDVEKPAECIPDSVKFEEGFKTGRELGFREGVESVKPAEWSEDFDEEVEKVHKRYPEVSFAKLTRIAYHFSKWANRHNGIEWSEEDEKMLEHIRYALRYACANSVIDEQITEYVMTWLKSLRPQPQKELSIEKAIQWLDDTFYFLDNSSGRGRDCEITTHDFDSLEEMYDSFRKAVIVDSEPHWTPSYEQIYSLGTVVKGSGDCIVGSVGYNLKELYEQLKKL